MIITNRKIPKELLYFRALEKRVKLSVNERKKFDSLEKGYAGEQLYDSIYDEVLSHLNVFRDIYLKIENSVIQCDSLIVSDEGFIVNEIKNFKGIYTYENERWYVRQNEISDDPIIQLRRTTNNLIKLKYLYNESFDTEGKVIFPNNEFELETNHPTIWNHVVVRHQFRRYLYSLKNLRVSQRANKFSEIIQNHIVENPYFDNSADFSKLRKGVYCRLCSSFEVKKIRFHFECQSCGHKDTMHTVVVQALSDFNILFHNKSINRKNLWEFLGGQVSYSTLNRYLLKYCDRSADGPSRSYSFKYYDFDEAVTMEIRVWRYKDMAINSGEKSYQQ